MGCPNEGTGMLAAARGGVAVAGPAIAVVDGAAIAEPVWSGAGDRRVLIPTYPAAPMSTTRMSAAKMTANVCRGAAPDVLASPPVAAPTPASPITTVPVSALSIAEPTPESPTDAAGTSR